MYATVFGIHTLRTLLSVLGVFSTITVDEGKKALMKEIFWAMNEIGSRTETATTTQIKVDGQTRILKESFDAW